MDLDDFKIKKGASEVPEQGSGPARPNGLDSLIDELKAADAKGRKVILYFIIIILAFLIIYSSVLIRKDGLSALGYEVLTFGFFLILIYGFRQFLQINKVDYSAPALVFLKEAERRYTFMKLSDWFITMPLIAIVGTGGGLIVYHTFSKYDVNMMLVTAIYVVLFIALVLFGFWASKKDWKKDKGEMLERIRKMRQEME